MYKRRYIRRNNNDYIGSSKYIGSSFKSREHECRWVWLFDRRFGYLVVTDRSARLIIRENKR